MILHVVAFLLSLIFIGISLIHFYWVFGGKWGLNAALPTKDAESDPTNPGVVLTLVVALGLLKFGLFVGAFGGLFPNLLAVIPAFFTKYGMWIISVLFFIRAIGDFNYIGFFKKNRHTKFAKLDSKFFSPLCLFIAILGILIIFLS